MIQQYLLIGAVIASFAAGFQVNSWYHDSVRLAEEQTERAEREAFYKRESSVAAKVEIRLQELKANERVIERLRTEVIERPVYSNDCIDDDGLRIINGDFEAGAAKSTY